MLGERPNLVRMDAAGNDERRALHYAVLRRDAAMTALLLENGADARQGVFPHRDATSALVLARDRGFTEIVDLIEAAEGRRAPASSPPADPEPEIRWAVAAGDAARVRELALANPAALGDIQWSRGGLLTVAVNHGWIEMIKLLLDLGADVDERTQLPELETPTLSWGTPLWNAARLGRLDLAQLLLERGADPNANVYASGWPLMHAYRNRDDAMKRLLVEHGAKPQPYLVAEACDTGEAGRMLAADSGGDIAGELAWAAADHGCPAVLELALARLDWPPDDPRWHWILIQPIRGVAGDADHQTHFTCFEMLLSHGASPNVARLGETILHFAAARKGPPEAERVRFAALLLDHGARLDLRDDLLASTPLGWACRWGRQAMADLLIVRGAPVHEPDAEPWATPLAWARKMGHAAIERRLREAGATY